MKKQQVRKKFWLWTLALMLSVMVSATALAAPVALAGDWNGALSTGGGSLRVVLHVTQGEDGQLSATVDSPDQGVTGIAVSSISLKGTAVHFEIEKLGAGYDGAMNKNSSEIAGTWKQGDASLPLTFTRAAK